MRALTDLAVLGRRGRFVVGVIGVVWGNVIATVDVVNPVGGITGVAGCHFVATITQRATIAISTALTVVLFTLKNTLSDIAAIT